MAILKCVPVLSWSTFVQLPCSYINRQPCELLWAAVCLTMVVSIRGCRNVILLTLKFFPFLSLKNFESSKIRTSNFSYSCLIPLACSALRKYWSQHTRVAMFSCSELFFLYTFALNCSCGQGALLDNYSLCHQTKGRATTTDRTTNQACARSHLMAI